MKLIKKILFLIIAFAVLCLIIAIFVGKDFEIERSTVINRDSDTVFQYIKSLDNHREFSEWSAMDPKIVYTSTGTDGEVGYKVMWESSNDHIGSGEEEITQIVEDEYIEYNLITSKPQKAQSLMRLTTTPVDRFETKLTWSVKGKIPYPFNLILLYTDLDAEYGTDLEETLNNLKEVLESK